MTHTTMQRRRSPEWVRLMAFDALHGLAWRLQRDFRTTGLTEGQDKLLSQCISELEWRHTHPGEWRTCFCDLCIAPFPLEDVWQPWEQLELVEGTQP